MNTRPTKDCNFRYGHFTNSCLESFDKIPVLEPTEFSHIQQNYPSTSFDESSIENEVEIDKSIYLDICEIFIYKLKLDYETKDYLTISMKNEEHGKPDMDMSFTDDDLQYLTQVNNLLHSLFSNCEVYLNNQ